MSGEFELIDRLKTALGSSLQGPLVGIGDDAAVLERPTLNVAATVDMQVEGIHFNRDWIGAEDLGRRALAVNLSDLAAMGATPKYAFVSLGISDAVEPEYLESVYRGIGALASQWKVSVAGGNTSRTPERLILDITVLGEVSGRGLCRTGAKAGDVLMATGPFGRSAAGLRCLQKLGKDAFKRFPELVGAHLRPEARVGEGMAIAGGATSAIDVSDGLAAELHHLAKASRVGFALEMEWLSKDKALAEGAAFLGVSVKELALFGGEDYELLFTCPPEKAGQWRFATMIGRVMPAGSGVLWGGEVVPAKGWDHLKSRT